MKNTSILVYHIGFNPSENGHRTSVGIYLQSTMHNPSFGWKVMPFFYTNTPSDWDFGSLEAGSAPRALCRVALVIPEQCL